jgi:two-component system cell cycle sensor histidine kinase/response regulator CckA
MVKCFPNDPSDDRSKIDSRLQMRTLRVLHLEDDAGAAERVRSSLEQENVDCTIDRVSSKFLFQKALRSGDYDLILSDFSSPDFDGLGALAIAKELNPDVPFLLLSENVDGDSMLAPRKSAPTDLALKRRLQRLSATVLRAHQEAMERRERKKNEDQIRQQADLLDHARDAIFVRNLNQEITYWNKGAERIYGWTSAEVIGKRASEVLYKQTAPPRDNIWKTVLEKGEWMGEIAQATKTGREIFVMSRRTLLRDTEETACAVLNINTDITEKREMESQIQRNQRMDSIGALAGGISHDLNNVLAPILLAAELLRDQLREADDIAMLDVVQGGAQRGIELIKQILQFTQGTKGQGTMKVKSVIDDLANLVRKTFPRSVNLETDLPVDLPTISCDPTQLHQIVLNLCVNARDAMPKGGTLSIQARNSTVSNRTMPGQLEPVSGSFVELAVSDTGTGIPPEVLAHILEPYFTTKPAGQGTGLGLSTVTTILRNIQGFLDVSTVVGKGTTFRVFLPATRQIRPAEVIPRDSPAFGRGEWILVVDDELALLQMNRELLEAHGYQVMTAIDGAEALLYFGANQEKIAVVIADMIMPGLAGDELIARVREKSPRTITICLSSSLVPISARQNELSPHAFLRKPCLPKDLIAVLQDLLAARESNHVIARMI